MNRVIRLLAVAALAAVMAACSSKLKDPSDLPSEPVIIGPHGAGFTDTSSTNFHGTLLASQGWDIDQCSRCHGTDYNGGLSGQSCYDAGCHADQHEEGYGDPASPKFHAAQMLASFSWPLDECTHCHGTDFNGALGPGCNNTGCHVAADGGPAACYTCHGNAADKTIWPQWYPTHTTHLKGGDNAAVTVECVDCHTVPNTYNEPAHINGITEVRFDNEMAKVRTKGSVNQPIAFDAATKTCANTYCHGNFTNGNNASPVWNGSDQGKCGTCHGNPATGDPTPKAPHPQVQTCQTCHYTGASTSPVAKYENNVWTVVDKVRHMNTMLSKFGTEAGPTEW